MLLGQPRLGKLVHRVERQGRRAQREVEDRLVGGVDLAVEGRRRHVGRQPRRARAMAACTSCAAASRLRDEVELQRDLRAAERARRASSSRGRRWWRTRARAGSPPTPPSSRGWRRAATALTMMVGKSTFGSALTGKRGYASAPNSRIATITSVVASGRRMNGPEMFMASPSPGRAVGAARRLAASRGRVARAFSIVTGAPGTQPHLPVDDHALARLDPAGELRPRRRPGARLDRPEHRLVVLPTMNTWSPSWPAWIAASGTTRRLSRPTAAASRPRTARARAARRRWRTPPSSRWCRWSCRPCSR